MSPFLKLIAAVACSVAFERGSGARPSIDGPELSSVEGLKLNMFPNEEHVAAYLRAERQKMEDLALVRAQDQESKGLFGGKGLASHLRERVIHPLSNIRNIRNGYQLLGKAKAPHSMHAIWKTHKVERV